MAFISCLLTPPQLLNKNKMETAKGREITNKEMIQAKDLRIGNWIMFGGYTHQLRLSDFNKKMDKYLNNGSFLSIPLTPQILEKAGFVKAWYEDLCQYELDITTDITIYNGDKNGFLEAVFECAGTELKRCQYVHQLQNLYFALSGTELTIEL